MHPGRICVLLNVTTQTFEAGIVPRVCQKPEQIRLASSPLIQQNGLPEFADRIPLNTSNVGETGS